MRKRLLTAVLIVALCLCGFGLLACADTDYGSLKIANISVAVGETAEIVPEFTSEKGKEDITYTFDGEKISIENGVVTGLAAGDTTVTAKTAHLEAEFTVTVTAAKKDTLTITAPPVYVHYKPVDLKVKFSNPETETAVTYTIPDGYKDKVFIENNKIRAEGDGFSTVKSVKINAKAGELTTSFTARIIEFNGAGAGGNSLGLEAKVKSKISDWTAKKNNSSNAIDEGGVLFVGDSFFDTSFWTNFNTTFSGKNVYTVGISATTTDDWELLSQRIVYPFKPAKIVLHCGTNNIFDDSKTASTAADEIKTLMGQFRENLPEVEVYYFSIEPRVGKPDTAVKDCNQAVKAFCDDTEWATYIDSNAWCYSGNTIDSNFFRDGVHPKLENYAKYVQALDGLDVFTAKGEVNYGTLTITAPVIYTGYAPKPLNITFSKPEYEEEINYTVPAAYADKIKIADGKISATGNIPTEVSVTVTAQTEHHSTTFSVRASTFNGANASGASLNFETRIANYLGDWEARGGDEGGVLFVGDSFFDTSFWSDFYTTYARKNAHRIGVSSSTTTDWEIVSERLVYPFKPETVVIHCGTNNIFDDKKSATTTTADIIRYFEQLHEALPDTEIYYFSIEPRVGKPDTAVKACNASVKTYCDGKDWLTYIDSCSWCYNGSAIDSGFFKDGVHPKLENYAKYVKALEDLGVEFKLSSAAGNTQIAEFSTVVTDEVSSSLTIMYRGIPLRKEYALSGKIDITELAQNGHLQFMFNGSNYRFLLWDANMAGGTSNGSVGLGWGCNNSYTPEVDKFAFTAGQTLTIEWKLVVTNKNAYFYFGDGSGNYTLEAVFVNVPVNNDLQIGSEKMAARVYDMTAKTKADDLTDYNALITGSEFDYYETPSGTADGLYINLPTGSGAYVIRDSERANNYISTNGEFYIKGKSANGDTAYTGQTRDWRVVKDGSDVISGDFVVSYNFEIVKRGTMEAIDALSAENISAKNWFTVATVSVDTTMNAWQDYHWLYWKNNDTTAKVATVSPTSGEEPSPTNLTATSIRVVIVRNGGKTYISIKAGETWYTKTCDIATDKNLTVFISAENVNGKITNFMCSKEAADVTAAISEIGKNA